MRVGLKFNSILGEGKSACKESSVRYIVNFVLRLSDRQVKFFCELMHVTEEL